MTIRIGNFDIGHGQPAFIIAEIAWAHDGSLEKAKKITLAAAQAGANALSVHITDLPSYMVRHYGNMATLSGGKPQTAVYDYLDSINLKHEDWQEIARLCKEKSLAFCVMPNDHASLEFAETLNPDAYVLPAACFVEEDFTRYLGAKRRPVILRIGGATIKEIEQALGWLKEEGAKDILLLHGFQVYPTPLEETRLLALPTLQKMFGWPVGLADHIDGSSELSVTIPLLALSLGAVALEKHITLDRQEKGEDFEAALDGQGFKKFVVHTRASEKALGESIFPPLGDAAHKYRQVSRKRVVAARDLSAGALVKPSDIACKRSDAGASPLERPFLLGRRIKKAVTKDNPIDCNDVGALMRSAVFLSARNKATRLPGKQFLSLGDSTVTGELIRRLKLCREPEFILLTTSTHLDDLALVELAKQNKVAHFCGSEEDKLERYREAAKKHDLDFVVIVDGDDPFCDPVYIDRVIVKARLSGADYISVEGLPLGATGFGVRVDALEEVCRTKTESDTEVWGGYFTQNSRFQTVVLPAEPRHRCPDLRMTLDYPEDYKFFQEIYKHLYKPGAVISLNEILGWLKDHPGMARMNQSVQEKYEQNLRRITKIGFKEEAIL